MKASRLPEIEALFHDARRVDPADRASFIYEACGDDTELRLEVESLLAYSDCPTTRLAPGPQPSGSPARSDRDEAREPAGTRIGNYKILQEIGEGGFGVVYMAQQQEPVQRQVALKIIKLGMDTRQVIARFEAERQALALMDHPNIARVLEAGATETGRPYFVMELVKGIPITDYCDRNNLDIRERLGLFVQVCRAVQHAHQKGIIHRDLKPSNVLVTLHDSRPVPKVIDFGIAKATSCQLTEKTLFTEFRQLIGTPAYMSPDQAEISGLDVDTRTDIYSLGVMLYELLTGTTPFDPETLRRASYAEIQRIIREEEPEKPSTRVQTLTTTGIGIDIARHHGSELPALRRIIRGDLDWIVMKAMEKDRTRRYQSAGELAAEVDRHLDSQPILAGPPSVVYKLRKFVLRHRLGVTAGLLIAAALVTGLTAATAGLVQARREAARSQRIAAFLQDVFVSTDPEQALARDMDVFGVLATAREIFGGDHATVAATLSSRALQLQSSGDLEGAEQLYDESLRIWRGQLGDENINVGTTLTRLGFVQLTKGDSATAEQTLREALRITRSQAGEESLAAGETLSLLATVLVDQGEYDDAATLLREALEVRRRSAPQQRLQIAITLNSLSRVYGLAGRIAEVKALASESIDAWRDALPGDSSLLARVLYEYGQLYQQTGEPDRAEELYAQSAATLRHDDAPAELRWRVLRALGGLTEELSGPAAAIPVGLEAVEIAPQDEGAECCAEAVRDLGNLAWRVARESDRPADEYRSALAAVDRALADKPESGAFINTRGILQYRLGDDEGALTTLARSHAVYSQQYEGGVPADLAFMALANHRMGHDEETRAWMARLRAAMSIPENARSEDNQKHLAEAEAVISQ